MFCGLKQLCDKGLVGTPPLLASLSLYFAQDRQVSSCSEQASGSSGMSYVEAQLTGLHRKDFVESGEWAAITLYPPFTFRKAWETISYFRNIIRPHVNVRVWNAREKEAAEGLSKREFFQKYGFVLLERKTAMTSRDWIASSPKTLDLSHFTGYGMPDVDTPLSRIYAKEVEEAIRYLLPESKALGLDPLCARRGPGTHNPNYSFGVHADYGFVGDDWAMPTQEVLDGFGDPGFKGMMVLNFWRPVLPMRGPVRKAPLAVCNPRSVKFEDVLPISIRWDNLGYVKMLALAHDEDQEWYYYPDMSLDEVLVFKSFQYFKSQEGPELNTCFHTAFNDPTTPPGAEPRQSAEYRVRVWF